MIRLIQKWREWIKWRVVAPWRLNLFPSYFSSHSELGEDMMIRGVLHHMGLAWGHQGFFIDIGAHHPVSHSNTWHFYRSGWRGVNVDATPGSMELFRVLRSRDVNIECCVTPQKSGPAQFFCFDQPLLNTVNQGAAEEIVASGRSKLVGTFEVPSTTLTKLCEAYADKVAGIDFLSIDIEGVDEAVLRSHDWERWRPRLIVFERHEANLLNLGDDGLVGFLRSKGYDLVGVCRYSFIMADSTRWVDAVKFAER
jgi:FkbM family methyltransferase